MAPNQNGMVTKSTNDGSEGSTLDNRSNEVMVN